MPTERTCTMQILEKCQLSVRAISRIVDTFYQFFWSILHESIGCNRICVITWKKKDSKSIWDLILKYFTRKRYKLSHDLSSIPEEHHSNIQILLGAIWHNSKNTQDYFPSNISITHFQNLQPSNKISPITQTLPCSWMLRLWQWLYDSLNCWTTSFL